MSSDLKEINIPAHIAIIMDGNGRWAQEHKLQRIFGHKNGAETVREITRECARIGVKRLTLYAFSQENWRRPKDEVDYLMGLLKEYLIDERKEIMDNNIRFAAIGRVSELTNGVKEELIKTIGISDKNTGMVLCLALNYGGRAEIIDAVKSIVTEAKNNGFDASKLDEATFAKYLYDPSAPEPDLLIRTGGEYRISNFLLWEISYSEIWVTPTYWPEFSKEHLHQAIRDYAKRQRRFGGLGK